MMGLGAEQKSQMSVVIWSVLERVMGHSLARGSEERVSQGRLRAGLGRVRGFMTHHFQRYELAGAILKQNAVVVIEWDRDNRTVVIQPFAFVGSIVARLLDLSHDLASVDDKIRSWE
jgi:hypothetical protein